MIPRKLMNNKNLEANAGNHNLKEISGKITLELKVLLFLINDTKT